MAGLKSMQQAVHLASLASCELKLFLKVEIRGTTHRVLCRLKAEVVPLLQALRDEELLFLFSAGNPCLVQRFMEIL